MSGEFPSIEPENKSPEYYQALCTRAADTLIDFARYMAHDQDAYRYLRLKEQQLITDLRKAAE